MSLTLSVSDGFPLVMSAMMLSRKEAEQLLKRIERGDGKRR
jgi:hypothetical protein